MDYVPFFIVDMSTGNDRADSIGSLLPPVIGLPVMQTMQESSSTLRAASCSFRPG